MSDQKVFKYTLEHYRKEGVSEEAFVKWFREEHLPYGVPLMKKHGITKYAAHYRSPPLADAFHAILGQIRPTWEISKADLVLEYWMPSLDCLKNLVTDPEWNEMAADGEANWIDMSRSTIHVGYETAHLENGNFFDFAEKK
ncbi:uncharacterized protein F4822DRAFT_405627 [Hypoxylon trugodes]|uniref:uncharacterized protein n=1 Tax=Hypoxylon trugodes TaxID=326681 RepID=UPI00218E556F|nr:uncharacterized protein F4822DRAFT_405627 [Hypoxylon trugodes]KAI1387157.1 hypothetical protein F4822DRAFT_405627 [Hypoxylon trugodes]